MRGVLLSFYCLFLLPLCFGYLPGLKGNTYCPKSSTTETCPNVIPLFADTVRSAEVIIPYKYSRLGFCIDKDVSMPSENLGQVLFGDRFEATKIVFGFKEDVDCQKVCSSTYSDKTDQGNLLSLLIQAIKSDYQHQWHVDDMPVVIPYITKETDMEFYQTNIPVGCYTENTKSFCLLSLSQKKAQMVYLFNHVDFTVEYHHSEKKSFWGVESPANSGRIVSIRAKLRSIQHPNDKVDCAVTQPLALTAGVDVTVQYTYSVKFKENKDIEWSSRWDYLLKSQPTSNIQWLSVINSIVILLFLSALVAFILIRTLRRDIMRYNELDNMMESQEDFGWKLVHGDVFRAPRCAMFLSVFVGSGVQVLIMALLTLFFGYVAFSSPAYRGAILTSGIVTFVLLGSLAGFTSARLYKFMGGVHWKTNVLLTSLFCPGVIFFIFSVLNITLAVLHSSAAVPFTTIVALLALWFGISLPLCFLGSFFAFRQPTIAVPVRTNQIPRQIPFQSCSSRYGLTLLMSGCLPFGCIFVQLYIMFSSLWGTQINYVVGFMFFVFIIFVVVTSETAILMCYFQLCTEDYHWWWRSFMAVGSSALYVFLYAIHFYVVKMHAHDSNSGFLFFGYIAIISWLFFLMTGTIGFLSCLWFVRKIYGVLKVD